MQPFLRSAAVAGFCAFLPALSQAASLDGATMSVLWALPFAGLLLSIALGPLVAAHFWHAHYGKIAVGWALAFLLPCALAFGPAAASATVAHALLAEYLPFVILLGALFAVAGGISIGGNLHGSARTNVAILALGSLLASIMGTTGAAMLLVRPLIRANDQRRHNAHVLVFFIFLVGNVGGALTPLGDPPLFLGFLNGVDFFWTLRNLFAPTLFLCLALLAIFYCVDSYYWRREDELLPADPTPDLSLLINGKRNFVLLAGIIGAVLMSGVWHPEISFSIAGVEVELQNLLRDLILVAIAVISLKITPSLVRADNEFSWAPMAEVAKLFIGIFIAIAPVMAMLKAGEAGAFAPLIRSLTDAAGEPNNRVYFWATGVLSGFLDNAPTYLVFFNTTGGEAHILMTHFAQTLAAISCGAVFMGALSYIGNAPNLMVKAIAEQRGIAMPGFFGYIVWSCVVLMPLFVIITFWFF